MIAAKDANDCADNIMIQTAQVLSVGGKVEWLIEGVYDGCDKSSNDDDDELMMVVVVVVVMIEKLSDTQSA